MKTVKNLIVFFIKGWDLGAWVDANGFAVYRVNRQGCIIVKVVFYATRKANMLLSYILPDPDPLVFRHRSSIALDPSLTTTPCVVAVYTDELPDKDLKECANPVAPLKI